MTHEPASPAREAFTTWFRSYAGSIDPLAMRLAFEAGAHAVGRYDRDSETGRALEASFDAWKSTFDDAISATSLEQAFHEGYRQAVRLDEVGRLAYEQGYRDALASVREALEASRARSGVGDPSFLNGLRQGYDNALHALRLLDRPAD